MRRKAFAHARHPVADEARDVLPTSERIRIGGHGRGSNANAATTTGRAATGAARPAANTPRAATNTVPRRRFARRWATARIVPPGDRPVARLDRRHGFAHQRFRAEGPSSPGPAREPAWWA